MVNENDPASIPYVINENGFWYVAYKEKNPYIPYVTVSAKGIANGLSTEINDGADFGPDSYDPSASGSYGNPPYTKTSGIQEAHLYRVSQAYQVPGIPGIPFSFVPPVLLLSGTFICNEDVVVYPNDNGILGKTTAMMFAGLGRNSISQVVFQGNSVYGFDFSGAPAGTNIHLKNLSIRQPTTSLTSLINANIPNTAQGNYITIDNVQFADNPANGIIIGGISFIYIVNSSSEMSGGNAINVVSNTGGDTYMRVIAFRGTGPSSISINGGIRSVLIDLKDTTAINVGSSGQIFDFTITGNSSQGIVNAGSISNLHMDGAFLAYSGFITNSGTINKIFMNGVISPQASSGSLISNTGTINYFRNDAYTLTNGSFQTTFKVSPALSANPPVSATVYQNTNPYDIVIDLPVYATTAGTAGTVAYGISSTSTVTEMTPRYVNGATSSTAVDIVSIRVPAGWYYEFTGSGVTFGTATVHAV